MNKMIKIIMVPTIMMVLSLILPLMAIADIVPWSTELYVADARYSPTLGETKYGPPLPITASYAYSPFGKPNTAYSNITSSSMSVSSYTKMIDMMMYASATFSGTYISTSDNPLFRFIYNGDYIYNLGGVPEYPPDNYAWLLVTDITDNKVLYDNSALLLNDGMKTIEVATIGSHEISVNFGARTHTSNDEESASINLTYNTAVVPEPISSILFVTGGTLLAGRRYIKKKKKA